MKKVEFAKTKSGFSEFHHYPENKGIDISVNDVEDSFCWGLDSISDFTSKSATWLA